MSSFCDDGGILSIGYEIPLEIVFSSLANVGDGGRVHLLFLVNGILILDPSLDFFLW